MAEISKINTQYFVKEVCLEALETDMFEYLFFRMLPLYHGPVKTSNSEMTISKDLLCAESPVSTRMFNNSRFKESQEQALDLEEIVDFIPIRALEALVQWLYRGIISFNIEGPEGKISAAMELVRFADMYEIDGLEAKLAKYIKEIVFFR